MVEATGSIASTNSTLSRKSTQTNLDDYEMGKIVGEGAYGQVILGEEKATGKKVAIKTVMKEQILKLNKQRHVFRERDLLKSMDHPNIIKLFGTTAVSSFAWSK